MYNGNYSAILDKKNFSQSTLRRKDIKKSIKRLIILFPENKKYS